MDVLTRGSSSFFSHLDSSIDELFGNTNNEGGRLIRIKGVVLKCLIIILMKSQDLIVSIYNDDTIPLPLICHQNNDSFSDTVLYDTKFSITQTSEFTGIML